MDKNNNLPEEPKSTSKVYFYIAIGACVLCAAAFGLAFTVLGIYALISSILLGIAALSFLSAQKKKNNFTAVKYVTILAYVLVGAVVVFFIGGLVYSASVNK